VNASARNEDRTPARGDIAIADVESLTHDARGVARIDGKATFIEGALPGERVRFRYHNKRPRFDTGIAIEILTPSPDRVTPPCPHFGVCGGCSLQHLAPAAQTRAKQQVLAETLEHVGRVRPERWLPAISGPDAGYRRRARLGARLVHKKGGVLVGFREKRRSFITARDSCHVLVPRFTALLPSLRALIGGLSRPDRIPQVEVAAGDEQLALVLRHLEPLTEPDRERLRDYERAHALTMFVQPGDASTIAPLSPNPTALTYALPEFDLELQFEPSDFVQVNSAVNRALVGRAIELLQLGAEDRLLDLFCGLGNFTLAGARRAGRVVGIEAEPALIERAQANAARNHLANVEFRVGNLYDTTNPFAWSSEHYHKLLLDPPRAGALEAIKALPADGPSRIVYVSCNPATLARDSDYLVHVLGYRLEAAGVADMFPHTDHVESIALYVKA
jgi:23S rRNA (uracil1939-C5)-methyltransferase